MISIDHEYGQIKRWEKSLSITPYDKHSAKGLLLLGVLALPSLPN
jgi:hypothetical protein